MNRISLTLLLSFVLMLGGCVTETTGPSAKQVDPQEVLQKLIDLGIGYLRRGDYGRAKDNIRKALQIDPDSPLALTTFGVIFQLEGENKLAEENFRKAIKSDPAYSQARNNFGAFLFARGRYSEAVEQLLVASVDQFYPKRPQVFENLGVSYLRLGETVKAEDAFYRATSLNINQSRALLELATIRYDQKNYVEAQRLYLRHVGVSQQSSRSLWLCIRIARVFEDEDQEASCALVLKNIFPATPEYKAYQQSS